MQHIALLVALVLTAALYANTIWVQQNLTDARYFNVIALAAIVLPACWSANLLTASVQRVHAATRTQREKLQRWSLRAWRYGLPVTALVAVSIHAGPPARLTFITEAKPDPLAVNADVPNILAHVPAGLPMIAVGKYWTAVPLVFSRLERKGGSASYAAVFHWEPMIPEIAALLQSGKPFTLVCLPPFSPNCLAQASFWSGAIPKGTARVIHGPAPLGYGGLYTIASVNE